MRACVWACKCIQLWILFAIQISEAIGFLVYGLMLYNLISSLYAAELHELRKRKRTLRKQASSIRKMERRTKGKERARSGGTAMNGKKKEEEKAVLALVPMNGSAPFPARNPAQQVPPRSQQQQQQRNGPQPHTAASTQQLRMHSSFPPPPALALAVKSKSDSEGKQAVAGVSTSSATTMTTKTGDVGGGGSTADSLRRHHTSADLHAMARIRNREEARKRDAARNGRSKVPQERALLVAERGKGHNALSQTRSSKSRRSKTLSKRAHNNNNNNNNKSNKMNMEGSTVNLRAMLRRVQQRSRRLNSSRVAAIKVITFAVVAFVLSCVKAAISISWYFSITTETGQNPSQSIFGPFLTRFAVLFTDILPDLVPAILLALIFVSGVRGETQHHRGRSESSGSSYDSRSSSFKTSSGARVARGR